MIIIGYCYDMNVMTKLYKTSVFFIMFIIFHDETSRINYIYISVSDGCQCIATKGGSETAAAAAQRRGSAEEFSYRLSFGTQSSPLLPQAPNWLGFGEPMGGFEQN